MEFPHLLRDKDRHGNKRYYVRIHGKPMKRLRCEPGTVEFVEEYTAALKAIKAPKALAGQKAARDTLGWLVDEFMRSHPFRQLDARSQRVRQLILLDCLREKPNPSSSFTFREFPLARLEPKVIKVLRDRKAETPGAANNRVRALRAVMKWAFEAEHIKKNVCDGVPTLKYKKEGFRTWTLKEVRQFEERHPIGTRPRLALALMLFTGVRRSDAVRLGPDHVETGELVFTIQKTEKALVLPILPELQAVLDASPIGERTFLETARGRPFTAAGFGNWFRDRCDEAGLEDCSAHGLRKIGATIAAENGATEKQLMAIFGWETAKLAAHYSKAADQKKLAKAAMHLLVPAEVG